MLRLSAWAHDRRMRRHKGDFQVQYLRKPSRCQRTTVSGRTTTRTPLHRGHRRRSATQKTRSAVRILGRGRLAVRIASCWRSARFSIRRSDREARNDRSHPKIDAILWSIGEEWMQGGAPSTRLRSQRSQYGRPTGSPVVSGRAQFWRGTGLLNSLVRHRRLRRRLPNDGSFFLAGSLASRTRASGALDPLAVRAERSGAQLA